MGATVEPSTNVVRSRRMSPWRTVEPSDSNPYDEAAESAASDLLADLKREAAREDLPRNLQLLNRIGVEQVSALLDAVRAGDALGIEEIVRGTVREDGSRRSDGLQSVLPRWARGTEVLTVVLGFVDVDVSQDPVTVTVHWERVPRKLRPATASLASELVDTYQPRPKGGRPRKYAGKNLARKLGDPDTGGPPA